MGRPIYIRGETEPVEFPVATAQKITTGDILSNNSNTMIRAADFAWNTSLAQTQADFAALFLGMAAQDKAANVARPYGNSIDNFLRVDTASIWEFNCVSANFTVGQFVGPAKDTGNAMLNDTVVGVADEAHAIGQVAEAGTALTRVKVKIKSKVLTQSK